MKSWLQRQSAGVADFAMCSMMNALQWRLRGHVCNREDFDAYLLQCEALTRDEFYAHPDMEAATENHASISWKSPLSTGFAENDRVTARIFLSEKKWKAPTLIILHALMSASDFGYRRWAQTFNVHGWNVAMLHLPFHYSRTPKKYLNGELAITSNIIRNGETIRQAVMEVRQLMHFFRLRGCDEFGLWATSYGGWIGALLLGLESDFRFASLMQPIVNTDHAIWRSPISISLRRPLAIEGITPEDVGRHAHLSSPLKGDPLCDPSRIMILGGSFDTVAPIAELEKLRARWQGSRLLVVPQGHFGYSVMNEAYRACTPFLKITE